MSVSQTITNRNRMAANPSDRHRGATAPARSGALPHRPGPPRTTPREPCEASAATPKRPSAMSVDRDARSVQAPAAARRPPAPPPRRQHRIAVMRADQRVPFPQHAERGDGPERDERQSAEIGRRDRERRQHQRRDDAQHQIAAAGRRRQPGRILVGRLRAGHGYEPVCAISPPNRRSRRWYSAIAPSSAARSKSGQ